MNVLSHYSCSDTLNSSLMISPKASCLTLHEVLHMNSYRVAKFMDQIGAVFLQFRIQVYNLHVYVSSGCSFGEKGYFVGLSRSHYQIYMTARKGMVGHYWCETTLFYYYPCQSFTYHISVTLFQTIFSHGLVVKGGVICLAPHINDSARPLPVSQFTFPGPKYFCLVLSNHKLCR